MTRADDVAGAESVVVISHAPWKRRYGGSPAVVGHRMTLGGTAFAIVGVMPPGLDYPNGVEVRRTVGSVPAVSVFGEAAHFEIDLIARLRPGVTIEQAAAELASIAKRLEAKSSPNQPRELVAVVRQVEEVIVGDLRPAMLALSGAVGSFCSLRPRTSRTSSCCGARCAAARWLCAPRLAPAGAGS